MKDLSIQRIFGDQVSVPGSALERFVAGLRGDVVAPGHGNYDDVRSVFNAMIDRRPGLIVRCAGAGDVIRAVDFARDRELLCAVRGGGHSIAGKSVCDGGVLIDLSTMKGIRVDPRRRRAHAQPGLRLGEFDRETQAFGLATTTGIVSDTGIAGLTLGGGIGWLNGRYGLACDNLLSADVVSVDGEFRTANAEENEDLFWGLRGGSGNFGVVTSFEYRLHPVGPVLGGSVAYPMRQAKEILRFYDDYSHAAPDELSTAAAFLPFPDGEPLVGINACYCGTLEEGERVLEPLRSFGSPVVDAIEAIPYVAMQSLLDDAFPMGLGRQHYWKSNFLRSPLSDEAIESLIACASMRPSPFTLVVLQQMHGAASRVDPADTAFPHRFAQYDMLLLSQWEAGGDADKSIRWARESSEAMRPFAQGVYVNNLGEEGDEIVREAYGANYDRLVALKKEYDSRNFLRLNQNIPPDA